MTIPAIHVRQADKKPIVSSSARSLVAPVKFVSSMKVTQSGNGSKANPRVPFVRKKAIRKYFDALWSLTANASLYKHAALQDTPELTFS